MKTKEELRLLFENGDKPTQEDFQNLMDSYWHKDEKIANNSLSMIVNDEFLYSNTDVTEIIGVGKTFIFPEGIKIIGGFIYTGAAKNVIIKVTFPNTLEKIKASAFMHQFLKGSLRIPSSCKVIESGAFYGANSNITELILEEGIETIGSTAFQFTGNKNVFDLHIPNSIRSVGQDAFAISSLLTVSAPAGLDLSISGIPATATITYR
ncbi:leucine-rich repeat domain-containing protein [Chryseobacterium sp. BLS98]|uniref:leucine-rich repeat domain-containing protein n=1 Tax=Chryseobacterium sp. BLS98 TaxID=885586 RepID=UPI000A5C904C|nr:leucine-rich repeat domain-containing protein [Chryseobacterium sp. BLS98]